MTNKVAIFGASSAIAREVALIWAKRKAEIFIVGRDANRLDALARELNNASASQIQSHVADFMSQEAIMSSVAAMNAWGNPEHILIAWGSLPSADGHELDSLVLNYNSVISLLFKLKQINLARGTRIGVISSVAGDRGRRSNYLYGSAKAGVSVFLSGFRAEMFSKGVYVTTLKPGWVDTPMTRHIKKNALFVSPKYAAEKIVRSMERKKEVAYIPFYWRWILLILCFIPERIFKRLAV